jgi:hypothetical protein
VRATLVERTGTRATVRLTPSWLARLFGARELVCELEASEPQFGVALLWRFAATRRDVWCSQHGQSILTALERVPVVAPPRAIARRA